MPSAFSSFFTRANAARAKAPLLRRALGAFARLARAAPPSPRRVKGKRSELAGKFPRSGKFSGSSERTLTRKEAGVLRVPGMKRLARAETVPRESLSTAAADAEGRNNP